VLYGCETWSLTLTEQAESVSEQGAAEDTQTEGTGSDGRPERRYGLCCSANIIREIIPTEWDGRGM